MTSQELRQAFLNFFSSQGHAIQPSASLIPADPTLLFTVAGMVPFKPQLLGAVKLECTRVASFQKCLRTSDIENVGRTRRHHTFFEMLGNFSFGDYFKQEAIAWAWEFLTHPKWLGLDPARLHVSVFRDDTEAWNLWRKMGVAETRIVRLGEDTNFWTMGPTGPCGPCSEIHYDFGRQADPSVPEGDVEHGGDRYVELWNNVFTQFDRRADGSLVELPHKNIDTGMGLERLAAVKQGVLSNFDTDLFQPLIRATAEIAGVRLGADEAKQLSLRVVAEHLRASVFLVADGVLPSNQGRGYVLRRIFRRALRHGRLLGLRRACLHELLPVLQFVMGAAYPELKEREKVVALALRQEEEQFLRTLDQGLGHVQEMIQKAKARGLGHLPGEDAFKLYDTFGFPLELTQELAAESGLGVDLREFDGQIEVQRERARASWGGASAADAPVYGRLAAELGCTDFLGYEGMEGKGKILAILKDGRRVAETLEGEEVELVLDRTPFYGEAGGQVGDAGILEARDAEAEVLDTLRRAGGELWVHRCRLTRGVLREGMELSARVEARRRAAIMRHHSAAHLLHAALRRVLGENVHQGGSLVDPKRLRFDFHHSKGLSDSEKEAVELQVNEWVLGNHPSLIREMPLKQAKAEGALAFFGEKYGEKVRVVSFGAFSKELCGGTHVAASGCIGLFQILSETSVSAGLRRIEALAGEAAYEEMLRQRQAWLELARGLRCRPAELLQRVKKLQERAKALEKDVEKLRQQNTGSSLEAMLAASVDVKGIKLLVAELPEADSEALKSFGDRAKESLKSGVIVLGSAGDGKVTLLAMVTKDLASKISAGKLVAELAPIVGGRGGGKPEMAQAGGRAVVKLSQALGAARDALERQLS